MQQRHEGALKKRCHCEVRLQRKQLLSGTSSDPMLPDLFLHRPPKETFHEVTHFPKKLHLAKQQWSKGALGGFPIHCFASIQDKQLPALWPPAHADYGCQSRAPPAPLRTCLALTIQSLDAPKVIVWQLEVLCVHPLVERSHDGTGVAGMLQA